MNINKDYRLIMNNIEGLVVIDTNERIVYMTDKLAQANGFNDGADAVNKKIKIKEVWQPGINNLYKIIETGKKQMGEIYFWNGITIFSNGFPLYEEGDLIGAVEYDTFENEDYLKTFLDKISEISKNLAYLKMEYKKNDSDYTLDDIVGNSNAIKNLKREITKTARSDAPLLINGETGSGKELVAHSVHNLSKRKDENFVKINCAAIPESLLESELFGYEPGSFTGALRSGRVGKIELANGGTLFLDEISRLPLAEQPKLLRVLQEHEITKVGSNLDTDVNIRIITATNENLENMVDDGRFRADLYYRINVMSIDVPPLREHKEDIADIAEVLLKSINNRLDRRAHRVEKINDEALALLKEYSWPGNVRELKNVLERAVNNCYDKVLDKEAFADENFSHVDLDEEYILTMDLQTIRKETEKKAILEAMRLTEGNKAKSAELLGITRQSLYNKLKDYEIKNKWK